MKSLTEHLWFEVPQRRGYLNITSQVEQLVRKSGIQEGLCLVNAMHITASVYINDDESGLLKDFDDFLQGIAPLRRQSRALPPQSHRRGQRGRPHQAPALRTGGRGGRHRGQARLRPLGADLLRGVRRAPPQARPGQDHRGVGPLDG